MSHPTPVIYHQQGRSIESVHSSVVSYAGETKNYYGNVCE